jgi:5-methylcytosine-specific restriction endonuclease McrA
MKKGPKFKRKQSTKERWLKRHGYKKIPAGKELDHKIPLSEGGTDTLWNLHLIKKRRHKEKTKREARRK